MIGLLRRFELDAGIIYLEGQDTEGLRVTPLYSERQVLMAAPGLLTAHDGPVTWPEVFGLPLWELADADVVISQPFWPAYLTADRIAKAPSLKLAWHIADSAARAYDLEGMDVGVIAAGRIGQAVLRRLAPFDVRLHYFDTRRLPAAVEQNRVTWPATPATSGTRSRRPLTTRGAPCRTRR